MLRLLQEAEFDRCMDFAYELALDPARSGYHVYYDGMKTREAFGEFLSLIPLTEEVRGLTLHGMKYPLDHAELRMGSSLGVSNEIVEEEALVELTDGVLIVFETRD